MGLVSHAEFRTSAEMLARYAAIKKQLYGTPARRAKPEAAKPIQAEKTEPVKRRKDVFVYSAALPVWKCKPTSFNQHVIDYLRHKTREEMGLSAVQGSDYRTMSDVRDDVLRLFPGINTQAIHGQRRARAITLPRQIICWEIKQQMPHKSFPEIGRFLGDRDHTTILSACRKIDDLKRGGELDWYFNAKERA